MSILNNTNKLQELLNKANSLPETSGGDGAGATINTCEVSMFFSIMISCTYTFVDESGNLNTATVPTTGQEIVLSNVCCNSIIALEVENDPYPGTLAGTLSGAEVIFNVASGANRYIAFKLTVEPGGKAHLRQPE